MLYVSYGSDETTHSKQDGYVWIRDIVSKEHLGSKDYSLTRNLLVMLLVALDDDELPFHWNSNRGGYLLTRYEDSIRIRNGDGHTLNLEEAKEFSINLMNTLKKFK